MIRTYLYGADLSRVESSAEADANGHITLSLSEVHGNYCAALLSRAEAQKIMADLATAMGLLEAPKVAA